MNNFRHTATALLCLLLLVLPAGAADFTASKIFGAPWLVLTVTQPAEAYAVYAQSPIKPKLDALLALPLVRDNLEFQKFMLEKDKAEVQLGYPLNLNTFCEMLGGADLALYNSSSGEPELLIILKVADAEKFRKLLAELEKSKDDAVTVTEISHQNKTLKVMSEAGDDEQFAWTMAADDLFLCGSLDAVKKHLDALAGGEAQRLDAAPDFQRAVSGLPKTRFHSFAYMNYAAMLDVMGKAEGEEQLFSYMKGQYGSMSFAFGKVGKPDRVELYAYIPTPADSKIAQQMTKFKPAKMNSINYLPTANTLAIWQNTWDGEFVWNTVMDTISKVGASLGAELGAADPMAQINLQIMQLEAMLGFKLKEDLFMGVGPEMFFNLGQMMGMQAEVSFGLQIRDAAKMDKVIQGLSNLLRQTLSMQTDPTQPAPNPIVTYEHEGVKISTVNYPMLALMGYTPGFFSDGKFFMIGTSLKALQDAINVSRGKAGNILAQTRYQKVYEFIGTEANQVSVIDIRGAVQSCEAIVISLLSSSWQEQDRQAFLAVTDLIKTLSVAGSSSVSSEAGTICKSVIFYE